MQNNYINSLLKHMFSPSPAMYESGFACPLCGATARDIQKSGKAGCAECYDTFSALLLPYIRRIHGNTEHTGKVPLGSGYRLRREIDSLKQELSSAVAVQDYEKAAVLRDKIRELEGGVL